MDITVRQLRGEEMLETLYRLNSYSLHPSPPYQNKEEWMTIVRERQGMNCYVVFEDDAPVSIAVSTPMTQNLRGKLYPVSGVWGVSTHPSARRKGYCRRAMAAVLSADREAGKAFSNLYPFRESFYEWLGYVSFPLTKIAKLTPASLSPLLKVDTGGELEQKLIGDAYDTYRDYLEPVMHLSKMLGFWLKTSSKSQRASEKLAENEPFCSKTATKTCENHSS